MNEMIHTCTISVFTPALTYTHQSSYEFLKSATRMQNEIRHSDRESVTNNRYFLVL